MAATRNALVSETPDVAGPAAVAIDIRGLRKVYANGAVGLERIDLSIEPGELVIFLGPSGSGKTTLLRVIAGLDEATEGEILFDSHDVTNAAPDERNISMVFQDLALYPHLKVKDNIAFPLRAHKRHSKDAIARTVREKANLLGIEHLLDRGLGQLSGGERQRVALARALVREPTAYLFDEPFSSLDAMLKREFRAELKRFQRQVRTTSMFVTHDQEDAMTMADRIALFRMGRLVQFGSPWELFGRPETLFAATFVGSPPINTAVGRIDRGDGAASVVLDGVAIPLDIREDAAIRPEVTLGVRPQDLRWNPTSGSPSTFPVEVGVIEPLGVQAIAHMTTPFGEWAGVFPAEEVPREGTRGRLGFEPSAVHLFNGTEEEARRIDSRRRP
ncbi:MAG: ABC transporter ATP-binding protein [Haloechinothrix sp.]